MIESIVLTGVGIAKGNSGDGFQYYQIIGKDEDEQQFLITFGVKQCYTESAEKTFKRMFAVGIPMVETIAEAADKVEERKALAQAVIPTELGSKKELTEYEKLLLED